MQPQPSKDPAIASILEIVLGFGGLPGMGWIYADRIGTGLQILASYWTFLFLLFGLWFGISILTFGLGSILIVCVIPVFLAVHFPLPLISAKNVNEFLRYQNMYGATQSQPTTYAPPNPPPTPPLQPRRFEPEEWWGKPSRQNQPVIKQGFSGGQVIIIVVLSIIAFIVFSCVALTIIGLMAGGPPPPR